MLVVELGYLDLATRVVSLTVKCEESETKKMERRGKGNWLDNWEGEM